MKYFLLFTYDLYWVHLFSSKKNNFEISSQNDWDRHLFNLVKLITSSYSTIYLMWYLWQLPFLGASGRRCSSRAWLEPRRIRVSRQPTRSVAAPAHHPATIMHWKHPHYIALTISHTTWQHLDVILGWNYWSTSKHLKTKPRKCIERENYQTECHAIIVKCIFINRCVNRRQTRTKRILCRQEWTACKCQVEYRTRLAEDAWNKKWKSEEVK